jgi:hypothetical protein
MAYKSLFRPCEVLVDGHWVPSPAVSVPAPAAGTEPPAVFSR